MDSQWTFLTNHSHVLVLLYKNPDLVLREVAQQVGITERAVQRIVADLEKAGYLQRNRVGRRNRYEVQLSGRLRHPVESKIEVRDLLKLLSSQDALIEPAGSG
ncbi:MAG: winged helix-turn-helix domain-containing protein [Planctomycetota bacterium]